MFVLDLCRELGMTQKQLLNPETGLSKKDLAEWMAYQRIKPFGYDEERRRFGMICAAISNMAGKSIKEDVDWTDFFRPSWEDPLEIPPDEIQKGKFDLDLLLHIFKSVAIPKEKNGN